MSTPILALYVSAYNISSSKLSVTASKETRAAQREGITSSGTIVSASSVQLPAHPLTNSPSSRNVLPSRELRENSSNISLPAAAPGPDETRKRNESPHPQDDSRSQRTIIRPHAEQVDRTASVRSSLKPSTSYPPPSSSSERRANTPHIEQVDRIASIQQPAKPSLIPHSSHSAKETRLNPTQIQLIALPRVLSNHLTNRPPLIPHLAHPAKETRLDPMRIRLIALLQVPSNHLTNLPLFIPHLRHSMKET